MPKPWCAEKLTSETPLPQAAALILAVKLPETLSYEAEARAGDVDGVHDMRVGSKRLREALRVFRPVLPERYRGTLLPFAEELNDALGLVREHDVLIQQFERIMENRTVHVHGIADVLATQVEAVAAGNIEQAGGAGLVFDQAMHTVGRRLDLAPGGTS